MINKAKKLGNKLGVVSTGGPVPPDREKLALTSSHKIGLDMYQSYSCSKYYADYTHDFANGSPQERLDAIMECLNDETIHAILASRGAAGSFDIIEKFPFKDFKKQKKLLIGNSDVTSLLVQMPEKASLCAIHGPTFGSSFADYETDPSSKESVDILLQMLRDPTFRVSYKGRVVKEGTRDAGRLLCGNLTMLVALLGTPYDVAYENKILLIEEVGEPPYKIKRLLEQLYFAGKFSKLKGLGFGRFAKCASQHGPSLEEVLTKFILSKLDSYSFSILKDLEFGHWGKNVPIPIGCLAEIDGDSIIQLESPIE